MQDNEQKTAENKQKIPLNIGRFRLHVRHQMQRLTIFPNLYIHLMWVPREPKPARGFRSID